MRDLRSELDQVPGIGPRRRRALLTAFGSLAGVRRATREELDAVVGAKAATAVIDYFATVGVGRLSAFSRKQRAAWLASRNATAWSASAHARRPGFRRN